MHTYIVTSNLYTVSDIKTKDERYQQTVKDMPQSM